MFTFMHDHFQKQKIYPDYFYRIKYKPNANPIFITVDWLCLNYIMNHRGICLFCKPYLINTYDFSFCYNKDIWIPYTARKDQIYAMNLGQAVQFAAASRILVIPFNTELLKGN